MFAACFLTGPDDPEAFMLAALLIPCCLLALTALLSRPGPRRDRTAAFFIILDVACIALMPTAYVAAALFLGLPPPKRIAGTWREAVLIAQCLFMGLLLWSAVVAMAERLLTLATCPRCGRPKLVRSFKSRPVSTDRYFQCGCCDTRCFVSNRADYVQGCPNCGRHALIAMPYAFYWCLGCRQRCRRLRCRSWEDAASEQDDGSYWLWDFGDWLQSHIRRPGKSLRANAERPDQIKQAAAAGDERSATPSPP
jgi:hypothetical protein